ILITAPAGFELSEDDSTYSDSLTLEQVSGVVADTTLYVRLYSATQGTLGGNITHTSDGADTKDVAVSGEVAPPNTAPVLDTIGNKSVDELVQLSFTASATDDGLPSGTLTYSLVDGTAGSVPAGATIGSSSGAFTWTPTEVQGPGTYTFDVCVSDGALSDCETITVTVAEVNVAPVLAAIGGKSVQVLQELAFTADATDADLPANTLTYSLADGTAGDVPEGAQITAAGAFTWTPTEAQGPDTYTFDVCVSDGVVSDCETIVVTVTAQATGVTLDGTPSSGTGAANASSVSFAHTTGSGANGLMLVGVSWNSGSTARAISSVTFKPTGEDALALTEVITQKHGTAANYRYAAIYRLVGPPSGTAGTVTVTFNGTVTNGIVAGAATFAGVNPVAPFGTAVGSYSSSNDTTPTVTLSELVGDELVVDTVFLGGNPPATLTPGSGQTQLGDWNKTVSNTRGAASIEQATGTSVTMSWTAASSSLWVIAAVPLKPAPVGTTYDLTVAVSPAGGGTTLPAAGTHVYPENAVVDITATPAPGYRFDHWEGACTDSGACQVTMTEDKTVTAYFTELPQYTLTVGTSGNGSVALDPAGGLYYEGTTITLTPVPGPCNTFDGWTGTNADDIIDTDGVYTIEMDEDKSVTANFVPLPAGMACYRVNAGGPTLDMVPDPDFLGLQFATLDAIPGLTVADVTGERSTTNTIDMTNVDAALPAALFQTVLYRDADLSAMAYNFAVPNGAYTVLLHEAEHNFTSSGQREFDIIIEGVLAFDNYDPFVAAGGQNIAVTESVPAVVTDGILTLEFLPQVSVAIIRGIEIVPAGDTAPPVLTVTGATADGDPMGGDLATGYILETTNDPTDDWLIQFAEGTAADEPLEADYFGLYLTGSTVSAADLEAYYTARGVPAPYLAYLVGAANGTNPFVYIKGDGTIAVSLVDAAKHDIQSADVAMTVPDDFPLGTYTVEGVIKDLAGNETTVTLILKVQGDRMAPTLDIKGATADGDPMDGDLATGYILETTNHPTDDWLIQFAAGTVASEPLAAQYFGLYLTDSTVMPAGLEAYYTARGVPAPYLAYLVGAANGTNPFVYIKGDGTTAVSLVDAAKHDLGSVDVAMTVPDDFPLGTYTVAGVIKDLAGNETAVTLKLVVSGDRVAPMLDITGATADGAAMDGDLATGFVLETLGNPLVDHLIQFAANTVASEPLAAQYFGLYLTSSTVSAADLEAYYTARGVPAPYLAYLVGAANGTNPFVYIKGSTVTLVDAAKHDIQSQDVDMTVPDNFPPGTYTVQGAIADPAGNETTVTLILIVTVDASGPVLTVTGATADGTAMGGTLEAGYILPTTNDPALDHLIQFAEDTAADEPLDDEYFGLYLVDSTVTADFLKAYYEWKGVPEPYLAYLKAAADKTNPFVY
ncbi:MAG: hypothetical protein GX616_03025, partial [Planctomycetes bacterium]|nr:hypothetical protein [Planctomycetota bacterium]